MVNDAVVNVVGVLVDVVVVVAAAADRRVFAAAEAAEEVYMLVEPEVGGV